MFMSDDEETPGQEPLEQLAAIAMMAATVFRPAPAAGSIRDGEITARLEKAEARLLDLEKAAARPPVTPHVFLAGILAGAAGMLAAGRRKYRDNRDTRRDHRGNPPVDAGRCLLRH